MPSSFKDDQNETSVEDVDIKFVLNPNSTWKKKKGRISWWNIWSWRLSANFLCVNNLVGEFFQQDQWIFTGRSAMMLEIDDLKCVVETLPKHVNCSMLQEGRKKKKKKKTWDVRVFHPHAQSYRHCTIQQTFRTHEQEKRRAYKTRIRQVDGGSFTPLVFTTAGGAGPAASVFLKHLGSKIAAEKDAPYSQTIGCLHCRLSFGLLCASILCIRGSRSLKQADPRSCQPDLAVAEGLHYGPLI